VNIMYNYLIHKDATSIDAYQSTDRCLIGHDGVLTTLLPGSRLHVRQIDRIICGREMLQVQGFPTCFFKSAPFQAAQPSDAVMRDLAGNSFCSNAFAAILIAVLVTLPKAGTKLPTQDAGSSTADDDRRILGLVGM